MPGLVMIPVKSYMKRSSTVSSFLAASCISQWGHYNTYMIDDNKYFYLERTDGLVCKSYQYLQRPDTLDNSYLF